MTTTAPRRLGPARDPASALDRLRQLGGRVTPAKQALVELFFSLGDTGITADEVSARLPDIDASTVYRCLAQLEQAGVVEHLHLGHGPATYRRTGVETVAVVCDGCGEVVEIDPTELDSAIAGIRQRHGITIDVRHFALSGRCASCDATDG